MDTTATTMRRFGHLAEIGFIPLSRLRPGDEAPAGSINVRKTDDPQLLPPLLASIEAKGVLQSVLGCSVDDTAAIYLAIGNRRLRALRGLLAAGKIDEDHPVPTIILRGITPAEARAASLAENIERAPLHPVDRFEAFAEIGRDGKSPDDIAAQFGLSRKEVNQSLALGALSPTIRGAWRDGLIGAGIAQLYTLSPSHKAQDAIFARLKKSGRVNSEWALRAELKANDSDAQRFVEFVGIEAYAARGGRVTRDLFGTSHVVGDAKLAKAMAEEKLQAECDRLVAEGWKWARPRNAVKDFYSYRTSEPKGQATEEERAEIARLSEIVRAADDCEEAPTAAQERAAEDAAEALDRIETAIAARSYTPRQKAKAGCIVGVDDRGRLEIAYGRIDPADVRKAESEKKAKEKAKRKDDEPDENPAGPSISNALANRLSCQLTAAAAAAIEDEPDLALPIALAALIAGTSHWGVRLSCSGMRGESQRDAEGDEQDEEFADLFERFRSQPQAAQLSLLARIVGDAFDFRINRADYSPLLPRGQNSYSDSPTAVAVCTAIDQDAMNEALRNAFDAADYFGAVSARLTTSAIIEMGHPPPRSMKKAELAEAAARLAAETGWLPLELRTVHYDGPGGRDDAIAEAAE